MDRPSTCAPDSGAAMRTARRAALDLLLPTAAGERGESTVAPPARRTVYGLPILRQSSHGRYAGGRAQTHPAADANSGNRGAVSEAAPEPAVSRSRSLSIPAARRLHRTAQPGLEHRYHIPSDAWRLPVLGGGHGLVQLLRTQLGTLQHDGDRVLSSGAGGGVPLRPTRNLELRSRFAIYRSRFSGAAEEARRFDQHGWTRPRPGQRVHRAPVAQSQIRAHLPRGLRQRCRAVSGTESLLPFLQPPAPAPSARLSHAGRSVPAPVNEEKIVAMMGGFAPHAPQDLSQFSSRVDGFRFAVIRESHTMEELDRRIGQRRDATRAPTQARSGWRPLGRLLDSPPHHLRNGEILSKQSGPPQGVIDETPLHCSLKDKKK